MTPRIALAALIMGMMLVGQPSVAADNDEKPTVKLGERPNVTLLVRPAITDAQKRRIRDLIASLAGLDKPDFGLSATMSGTSFAPLPDQNHPQAFLMTNHGIEPSSALKELVTFGPDALPSLLDSLDDQTPTKVVIHHEGFFGAMWFARELNVNPVNPAEQHLENDPRAPFGAEEHIADYTIKIGDVCFVAIGQIFGRGYEAVRYQPTACIVLNSPTHDKKLCDRVRAIWKSDDATGKLFASFCSDYATVGLFNDKDRDGWYGSCLQCSAALRMLFYFPRETVPLIAARLDSLDVKKDGGLDDFAKRCVANRVRSDDFIKSVAWSRDPAIRRALTGLFARAEDVESLLAAAPAVDDKDLIRKKVEAAIVALPVDDGGPYGDAYHLLGVLIQRTPDAARPMFDEYLKRPTVERCHTVCVTLRGTKLAGDVRLLLPLLSDSRTFGWTQAIVPGQDEPRLPIRICDEAAVTLSQNHPTLKFIQAGQYADMDRQIAAIQATLAEKALP